MCDFMTTILHFWSSRFSWNVLTHHLVFWIRVVAPASEGVWNSFETDLYSWAQRFSAHSSERFSFLNHVWLIENTWEHDETIPRGDGQVSYSRFHSLKGPVGSIDPLRGLSCCIESHLLQNHWLDNWISWCCSRLWTHCQSFQKAVLFRMFVIWFTQVNSSHLDSLFCSKVF